MENLKNSNELLEAIANGVAFDKETGLIWEHWLITINEQIVKNNVGLGDVSQRYDEGDMKHVFECFDQYDNFDKQLKEYNSPI